MMAGLVCVVAALIAAAPQKPQQTPAKTIVARAIDALGGEAALKRVAWLHIESIGHDYYIDHAERPEGPFIVTYVSTTELRDVAGGRSRIQSQQRDIQTPDWRTGPTTIVDREPAG